MARRARSTAWRASCAAAAVAVLACAVLARASQIEIGMQCQTNADCEGLTLCHVAEGAVNGTCQWRSLFGDFSWREGAMIPIAFVATALASGSGVGGGGLLVPILLTLQDGGSAAIPLANFYIFGAAIASAILNLRQRHPKANRPLIDFNAALVFEPTTLAGTFVGVILNRLFPQWLTTILLILLLGFTGIRTLTKGVKQYRTENAAIRQRRIEAQQAKGEHDMVPMLSSEPDGDDGDDGIATSAQVDALEPPPPQPRASNASATVVDSSSSHALAASSDAAETGDSEQSEALQKQLRLERRTPCHKIAILFVMWIIVLGISILRGGHGAPSVVGIACGSLVYWLTLAIGLGIFIMTTMLVARYLIRTHQRKLAMGYTYLAGDVQWNKKRAVVFPVICTVAGIAAGLLGIGGGMVKGPLMVEMGMLPQIVSSTSSFMILFTSSSTSTQFLILGSMPYDYAGFSFGIGFLAGLIGQFALNKAIKKSGRAAILVLLLGSIVLGSTVFMGVQGILHMVSDGFGPFRPVCG